MEQVINYFKLNNFLGIVIWYVEFFFKYFQNLFDLMYHHICNVCTIN